MKHFFSTKVKIVLVLAALIAAGLAVFTNLTDTNPGGNLVQGILTPIRAGTRALTDQAERFYSYLFRYESLEAENAELKQQLARMEENARQSDALTRENDRLRALLELAAVHEDYELVDGYIISRNSNQWNSTMTVSRGSSAGIAAGMCAITANGEVVGLVTEVGSNYAVIKTVLDYSGVVQGGYATGNQGLLRMDYLPSSAVIRNNDQVVTAGSTVYPRNLVLGHVVDAGFDDTGVAKFALLEPAADIANLEQVFIITQYDAS